MSLTNSFSSLSSSFSYDFRRLEYFGRDVCGRLFTSRSICSSFNVNIHNIQQCNHIPSELVAHCLNAYSTEYPTQNIMIIAWHQHTKEDTKTNIKLLLDDGNILLIPKIDITRILVLMLLDSFHRHCTLTDIVHSQTLYTHRHCTLAKTRGCTAMANISSHKIFPVYRQISQVMAPPVSHMTATWGLESAMFYRDSHMGLLKRLLVSFLLAEWIFTCLFAGWFMIGCCVKDWFVIGQVRGNNIH